MNTRKVMYALREICNTAFDMTIQSFNQLRAAVERNENINRNPTVQVAIEQHQNDLESFRRGEVSVDVPLQSHERLRESIVQAEPDKESYVRYIAKVAGLFWKIRKVLGIVLLVGLVVVGKSVGGH